ncbi:MAG TPA: LemA family protein [Alphaproteobacteria bacterium]|nr:LemA family protein [Alphaproteobacteria bacterium]
MESWMIWAGIGVVALFLVVLYNRIVALVQRRKNAFSDIDVQLKLRHDLIPNLVNTVKGYASHESGVFARVTEARASAMRGGSIADRAQAEGMLGAAMMNLMAVAENYPQLKADSNFQQLQAELSDIENKIAAARRFFNNATSEYNTVIQQFPAVLIARMFGFKEEVFFELDAAEKDAVKTAPNVNFGT